MGKLLNRRYYFNPLSNNMLVLNIIVGYDISFKIILKYINYNFPKKTNVVLIS